ncbi:SRPBCC domain-containing protein [Paenibacillus sp. PR3]|uniref:SRPBCC domain-containing protein n=1 Tax=Paenibacillus terricola TaxID=2763503 RepID=A0ABR8N479_9BACL|nr:SRPBCC domain-containing protein [Paenibacillus terricola]MBD3922963.1 SRPBCC domain-containing protein [Paenibacillus terricola]
MQSKVIGQTQSSGFQIGVRRTFDIPVEKAWDLIVSAEGVQLWLGQVDSVTWEKGQRYQSKDGISGEIRTINIHQNIRLTWKKANWDKPSTVQIRTIAKGSNQTTISFHQENLSGPDIREEMKLLWEDALSRLKTMI